MKMLLPTTQKSVRGMVLVTTVVIVITTVFYYKSLFTVAANQKHDLVLPFPLLKLNINSESLTKYQLLNITEPTKQCNEPRKLPEKKLVAISASTPALNSEACGSGSQECSYAFYLPLTALSWHRLNFSVVVLIAGDDKPWKANGTHLNHVYNTLTGLGFVDVVFLKTSPDMQTGIAQIGRLFVADLAPYSSSPDTYLVTSDADLFPVTNIYDIPKDVFDIRFTNGFCCDPFPHKGESIGRSLFMLRFWLQLLFPFSFTLAMVALSSIGMRISTWHEVMKYRKYSNNLDSVKRIKETIMKEFGHLPINATRGANNEWFFDQQLISIRLHHYFNTTGKLCRRSDFDIKDRTRWDRIAWPRHLTDKKQWLNAHDAHCPLPGHTLQNFIALHPLAQLLAGDKFDVAKYWYNYMKLIPTAVPSYDKVEEELGADNNDDRPLFLHQPHKR